LADGRKKLQEQWKRQIRTHKFGAFAGIVTGKAPF
jgi:hypothetical protein